MEKTLKEEHYTNLVALHLEMTALQRAANRAERAIQGYVDVIKKDYFEDAISLNIDFEKRTIKKANEAA